MIALNLPNVLHECTMSLCHVCHHLNLSILQLTPPPPPHHKSFSPGSGKKHHGLSRSCNCPFVALHLLLLLLHSQSLILATNAHSAHLLFHYNSSSIIIFPISCPIPNTETVPQISSFHSFRRPLLIFCCCCCCYCWSRLIY